MNTKWEEKLKKAEGIKLSVHQSAFDSSCMHNLEQPSQRNYNYILRLLALLPYGMGWNSRNVDEDKDNAVDDWVLTFIESGFTLSSYKY